MDQKFGCHFIIKELGQKFKGQFSCLRENTEKYINFLVQIEKEVKIIGKNGEEIYRFAEHADLQICHILQISIH